jgi:hypothetical protein
VAVADDVSTGELTRRLDSHEEGAWRAHEALGSRITDLAAHTVPLGEWQRAERVRDEAMARVEREHDTDLLELRANVIKPLVDRVEKLEKRSGVAWGWVVAGGTLFVTVLGVLIQAWAAAKGAK